MEKWLVVEASCLLRLLMAPSSHPKGSGKHLPSSEMPDWGGCCHLNLSPAGTFPAPYAFVPPSFPGLAPKSFWKSTSPKHGLQARFRTVLC